MTSARRLSDRAPRSLRSLVALLGIAIALPGPRSLAAQESWPIDRWLVAAVPEGTGEFETDRLEAPGETGVLPDRGRMAAGVSWKLVREDEAAAFSLDSILDAPVRGDVAYAHAYVRISSDRTLRLRWSGTECTRAAAWLNGRPVTGGDPTGGDVAARFGAGWNTLLLKLQAGDCPFGFRAALGPGEAEEDGEAPRIQASRPYGDVRTGPEDWVVPADTARIAAERRWRGDRLYAGLVIELTAWARAAVADVELELRDGPEGRASAAWLVPGEAESVVVPVRLDRLDRLLSAGVVNLRIAWGDRESDHRIVVEGSRPTPSSRVVLDGWNVISSASGANDLRANARLPNDAGWRVEGEWEVPEALAGKTLILDVATAPADYVLNQRPVSAPGAEVTLCSPCAKGVELHLAAVSTDAWTAFPAIRAAP